MIAQAFARASAGRARWWIAAAVLMLSLGATWDFYLGYLLPGMTTLVNQFNPNTNTNTLDLVPYYVPGFYSPGYAVHGYETPARVFLVLALGAVLARALGSSSRAVERVALGALVACLALALSSREGGIVLLLAGAVALVGRRVWIEVRNWLLASSQPFREPSPAE